MAGKTRKDKPIEKPEKEEEVNSSGTSEYFSEIRHEFGQGKGSYETSNAGDTGKDEEFYSDIKRGSDPLDTIDDDLYQVDENIDRSKPRYYEEDEE